MHVWQWYGSALSKDEVTELYIYESVASRAQCQLNHYKAL